MANSITEFETYLHNSRIPIRIACETKSGWPVVISLWYIYIDGLIYCASKESSRIVSYLKSSPRCAYEIASDLPPYCGLRGQAIARIDSDLGPEILDQLIDRYLGVKDNKLGIFLRKNQTEESAIILKPVNVFSWNFTQRMDTVSSDMIDLMEKTCPI